MEQIRVVAAVFAGSEALGDWLLSHPEWLGTCLRPEDIGHPRQEKAVERELESMLEPCVASKDFEGGLRRIRAFKWREMFRIGARDLARLGGAVEITAELSDLATVCLSAVERLCRQQLQARFGTPWHRDPGGKWRPTEFCLLGMGKLGGRELNYSSDVDLLFVYEEEGSVLKTPPARQAATGSGMRAHVFFSRLSELIIAELSRSTGDGMLYRVDVRLRPEGSAGPLARSLSSYENYYAQWGQTWERMMLMKARWVAGSAALGSEFLETVQPFRYPRFVSERVLREIAAMKQRTENEIVRDGELQRNVKLGRGGIREIEFVAQSLQLLHGGKSPFLQISQTLTALGKLADYQHLPRDEATRLGEAYVFLRDVEHRLQMENNLQTHTLPESRVSLERMARLLGFPSAGEFEHIHSQLREGVSAVFHRIIGKKAPESSKTTPDAASRARIPAAPKTRQQSGKSHTGKPQSLSTPAAAQRKEESFDTPMPGGRNWNLPGTVSGAIEEWRGLLREAGFRDPDQAVRSVQSFVEGPGYVHISPRTSELALELMPRFLELCPGREDSGHSADRRPFRAQPPLSDPDRVLARLGAFIEKYGARAMLYEMWISNPSLYQLLLLLFDRSEFLAEMAIRTPDIVDELEQSGRLRRSKPKGEILKDLRFGLDDVDQKAWIRKYHHSELMRLGLRDILGLVDFEENLAELSRLADACLEYALEMAMKKLKLSKIGLAVIGLGKLGGGELNYGSDLDILFVADVDVEVLPQLQPIARGVIDLLSNQTALGVVFEVDTRLRPDGEKGLLINTLGAYETYYRERARFWELQSLTRCRWIAGDADLGARFVSMACALTSFGCPQGALAGFAPDWKTQVARMRLRIEKERTEAGGERLAFKTGRGGLMDAEFVAQSVCLERGFHEPNTLRALQAAREKKWLARTIADPLAENYRFLRRVEGILRRWSFVGESVLPGDIASQKRVAIRCGFEDAESFLREMDGCRLKMRAAFEGYFALPESKGAGTKR